MNDQRIITETLAYDYERGIYFDPAPSLDAREARSFYTAFCGGCGEEIDVAAFTDGQARSLARQALEEDYVSGLKIDRIERRDRGLIYF